MHRTALYLPDDLRAHLAQAAKRLHVSEAELVRKAIERHLMQLEPPRPKIPLFASGQRDLAENVDEALAAGAY